MRAKHYRHEATIPIPYRGSRTRVCWSGQERRFETEEEAEKFAVELRKRGEKPCVCSA